jgi:D-alanyl-lipoteichoic acid acyltransferase DltB (MBOAT superfamily)
MQNFAQPYLSSNITQFWRRWHISLSSWLRDYLYIALGGNRKGILRTYINLMLTMLLGGLWHGANWTFVFWGALHGLYLIVHKLILGRRTPNLAFTYINTTGLLIYLTKAVGTYLLVLFAWLFFRAENIEQAFLMCRQMAQLTPGDHPVRMVTITVAFAAVTILIDIAREYYGNEAFLLQLRNKAIGFGILAGMLLTSLLFMFVERPHPFIYFQF